MRSPLHGAVAGMLLAAACGGQSPTASPAPAWSDPLSIDAPGMQRVVVAAARPGGGIAVLGRGVSEHQILWSDGDVFESSIPSEAESLLVAGDRDRLIAFWGEEGESGRIAVKSASFDGVGWTKPDQVSAVWAFSWAHESTAARRLRDGSIRIFFLGSSGEATGLWDLGFSPRGDLESAKVVVESLPLVFDVPDDGLASTVVMVDSDNAGGTRLWSSRVESIGWATPAPLADPIAETFAGVWAAPDASGTGIDVALAVFMGEPQKVRILLFPKNARSVAPVTVSGDIFSIEGTVDSEGVLNVLLDLGSNGIRHVRLLDDESSEVPTPRVRGIVTSIEIARSGDNLVLAWSEARPFGSQIFYSRY